MILLSLSAICVTLVVLLLGLAWRTSILLTSPRDYRHPLPPDFRFRDTPLSLYGLDFDDIAVRSPSGETIRGWLVPAQGLNHDLAAVTVHGRGGDRRSHLVHLPMLHEAGATVALMDLRENGLSDGDGRGTGLGTREAEDAIAVVSALRDRGYRNVVLFGCSLGASASLIAAARDPRIAGVVAECPFESSFTFVRDDMAVRLARRGVHAPWIATALAGMVMVITHARLGFKRFDEPIDVMARIAPRPVLIVHGHRDNTVLLAHGQRLASRSGGNASLVTIPEAGHCNGFETAPDLYAAHVRRLLAQASRTKADR